MWGRITLLAASFYNYGKLLLKIGINDILTFPEVIYLHSDPPRPESGKMKSSFKLTGGFTIVEVAMATAVLAIGLAGMVQAMGVGSEMLDTARKQTIASQVIQSEIERLRMLTWTAGSMPSDLNVTDLPATVSVNASLAQVAPANLFNCTRTVQLASGRSDLRQVTITVSWTGITGKTHSRSTNVYIGKYGLNVAYQKL